MVRGQGFISSLCYLIFDIVLYPNSVYFAIMIVFFFFLVIGLLAISGLNYLGFTNINIDFLADIENSNKNGLTEAEIARLTHENYHSTRPPLEER